MHFKLYIVSQTVQHNMILLFTMYMNTAKFHTAIFYVDKHKINKFSTSILICLRMFCINLCIKAHCPCVSIIQFNTILFFFLYDK